MEIVIPSRSMDFDFNFNSVRSSPCSSIPSTPLRFGDYSSLSAPTSPTRMSELYRQFENFLMNDAPTIIGAGAGAGTVPFQWEDKPGTPKSILDEGGGGDDDFAFDFSADLEKKSLPADELFDGGVIRPLKPPPRLQLANRAHDLKSPNSLSPRSPKEILRSVFSPRRKKVVDPFEAAVVNLERGRERKDSSRRGGARSVSPYRVSQYSWEEEEEEKKNNQAQVNAKSLSSSSTSCTRKSSRRWRLTDFLLFRSASEGRESSYLRKYSRKTEDASFRSTSTDHHSSGSWSRGNDQLQYNKKKEVKRRTFLPYKTGILGVLGFR